MLLKIVTPIAVCLLFFAGTALSSDTHESDPNTDSILLSGYVYSPEGKAVPGVKVTILETGQKTLTDNTGRFRLTGIRFPEITFLISCEDFEQEEINLPVAGLINDQPLKLHFKRIKTFKSTVVITGTGDERALSDTTVRTEVITFSDILKKGANDVADALEGVTGLRVENNCQNCGFNQLRINGLEGGYSQLLVDGLNSFSSLAAVYGLEHLPANMIERIEVVKGGGSALYGAGAVGGVVNIITREPFDNSFQIRGTLDSIDGATRGNFVSNGSYVFAEGIYSLSYYTSVNRTEAYDRNDDGFSDIAKKENEAAGITFFGRFLDSAASLKLGFDMAHEFRRGGEMLFELAPHLTSVTEEAETDRTSLNMKWVHSISGSTYYELNFSRITTDRDSYYGSDYDPSAYGTTQNPNVNAALILHHSLAEHDLLAGIQYLQDELTDIHPAYQRVTDQKYDNYGIFLQDSFAVTDKITLLGGIRLDEHSMLNDSVFSPRVSVLWSPLVNLRIRGTAAYGFKAPALFSEDLHIEQAGGNAQIIYNDSGLKEENVKSYGLSAEITNIRIMDEVVGRFETNLFYNILSNTFVLDEDPDSPPNTTLFRRINGGGADVYGVEINASVKMGDHLNLESGFTIQRAELDDPEPDFGSTGFFRTPDNYGYLTALYDTPDYAVQLRMDYTGSMVAPHYAGFINEDRLETTDQFLVISSRIEIPIFKDTYSTRLYVNLHNITDEFQEDLDIGSLRDAGYIYGPRKPRTFSIGFSLEL